MQTGALNGGPPGKVRESVCLTAPAGETRNRFRPARDGFLRAAECRGTSGRTPLARSPRLWARSVHDSPASGLLRGASRPAPQVCRTQHHHSHPSPTPPESVAGPGFRPATATGPGVRFQVPSFRAFRCVSRADGRGTFWALALPPKAVLSYSRAFPGFGVSGASLQFPSPSPTLCRLSKSTDPTRSNRRAGPFPLDFDRRSACRRSVSQTPVGDTRLIWTNLCLPHRRAPICLDRDTAPGRVFSGACVSVPALPEACGYCRACGDDHRSSPFRAAGRDSVHADSTDSCCGQQRARLGGYFTPHGARAADVAGVTPQLPRRRFQELKPPKPPGV